MSWVTSQRTILEKMAISQGKQVLLKGKAILSTSWRLNTSRLQPSAPVQVPAPELSALSQASNAHRCFQPLMKGCSERKPYTVFIQ